MISREFIYEFSNFDDIKSRENDKKSRAMGLKSDEMGVLCEFGVIQHYKVGFGCRQNLRSSIKHPLRVRVWRDLLHKTGVTPARNNP